MRTAERLTGLKKWVEKNLCEDREMKAPGPQNGYWKDCTTKACLFSGVGSGKVRSDWTIDGRSVKHMSRNCDYARSGIRKKHGRKAV